MLCAAMFCGGQCGCLSCQNTVEHKGIVQRKREHILTRYPNAFDEKVTLLWHIVASQTLLT